METIREIASDWHKNCDGTGNNGEPCTHGDHRVRDTEKD